MKKKQYDQTKSIKIIQEYIKNPNIKTERALFKQFSPLIRKICSSVYFKYKLIGYFELFNIGMTEMFKIIPKYDASKGRITTFIMLNVRGRMIDEYRYIMKTRYAKENIQKFKKFDHFFKKLYKITPSKNDFKKYWRKYIYNVKAWKCSFEKLYSIYIENFYEYSLDFLIQYHNTEHQYSHYNFILDNKTNPDWTYTATELINNNEKIIQTLTNKEKYVIDQYFFWGLSLKQIGEHLSVTESRVSQILDKIKHKLKDALLKKYTKEEILEEIC